MSKIEIPGAPVCYENGNRIYMGEGAEKERAKVLFRGKNNILFLEGGLHLGESRIAFAGDNSIAFLRKSSRTYRIAAVLHSNSALHIGEGCSFNGILHAVLSEGKHFFAGDDAMFSTGITARTADTHVIYSTETGERANSSKSIYLGDHVWIGQGVTLLKGTAIHSGSIIGSMSVCAGKTIPSNVSWGGNPARQIADHVFWERTCTHAWTQQDIEAGKTCLDSRHVYRHDPKEHIPFHEIDAALDGCCNADAKMDYLAGLPRRGLPQSVRAIAARARRDAGGQPRKEYCLESPDLPRSRERA